MNERDKRQDKDRETPEEERRRRSQEVTEGSEESFPASDPPATSYPGDGGPD